MLIDRFINSCKPYLGVTLTSSKRHLKEHSFYKFYGDEIFIWTPEQFVKLIREHPIKLLMAVA